MAEPAGASGVSAFLLPLNAVVSPASALLEELSSALMDGRQCEGGGPVGGRGQGRNRHQEMLSDS